MNGACILLSVSSTVLIFFSILSYSCASDSLLKDLDRLKHSSSVTHDEYEIIAQSICTGLAIQKNLSGWVYAVERVCSGVSSDNCDVICTSPYLHVQDEQTAYSKWKAIGAYHVYKGRPSSLPGTRNSPRIGLKVSSASSSADRGCGPNYCCCYAF